MGTDVRLLVAAPDAPLLAAAARELIEGFEAAARASAPAPSCARSTPTRGRWCPPRGRCATPCARRCGRRSAAAAWSIRACSARSRRPATHAPSRRPRRPCRRPPAPVVPRRRAAPPAWRDIAVDDAAGTISRPPGLRLDLGGSGKGHVADRVAALLAPAHSWVVDCGGDVRLGGAHEIHVAHPLGGPPAARLSLADAAVATSSVVRRAWRTRRGPAHHLLDPATGAPAWAGVLAATAFAPTALEAETLAKVALLTGDPGVLAHGGVLVRAGGDGRARRARSGAGRRTRGGGGMTPPDPAEHAWWLASRAAGVVALLCITGVGRPRPGDGRPRPLRGTPARMLDAHQWTALVGLVAIAVHGITLLGDAFLDPGLAGIAVPFVIDHAPLWTGLGVTGGWLAAILGLTYWARERIGPRLWRQLHKATLLVYVLSVAHTLGAGTDAGEPWMRVLLLAHGRADPVPLPAARPAAAAPASASCASPRSRRSRPTSPRSRSSPRGRGRLPAVRARPVRPRPDRRPERAATRSPRPAAHRISVKRDGAVSGVLHAALREGDTLEVGAPAGPLHARPRPGPAGGAAQRRASARRRCSRCSTRSPAARSAREVWWIHGARNGREHAFARRGARAARAAAERARPTSPTAARSRATPATTTSAGSNLATLERLGVPLDAAFHLCGSTGLRPRPAGGPPCPRRHPPPQRGVRRPGALPRPADPSPAPAEGPAVTFSRSGVEAPWGGRLAARPRRGERRAGALGLPRRLLHGCRTPVLAGAVRHDPSRSTRRRRAPRCCAARGRRATSCSTRSAGGRTAAGGSARRGDAGPSTATERAAFSRIPEAPVAATGARRTGADPSRGSPTPPQRAGADVDPATPDRPPPGDRPAPPPAGAAARRRGPLPPRPPRPRTPAAPARTRGRTPSTPSCRTA